MWVDKNHKKEWNMTITVGTVQAIGAVVQMATVGTNLVLAHSLWAMMSGGFLPSCGAFFPALDAKGFGKEVVRRSWGAQIFSGPAVRRC